jgi:hypothetical protein
MDPHCFESKSDAELLDFLESFCEFGSNRAYLLCAMARPKENESITSDSQPIFREIVTREEKLRSKYSQVNALANNYIPESGEDLTFRLYISANARDVEKSFFLFQKALVDLQKKISSGHEQSREKIKRLDKEWESTLQGEGNKVDNYFIIDVDADYTQAYTDTMKLLDPVTEIRTTIKTPNGYHIITEPFNYPAVDGIAEDEVEVKTDGLMFLTRL